MSFSNADQVLTLLLALTQGGICVGLYALRRKAASAAVVWALIAYFVVRGVHNLLRVFVKYDEQVAVFVAVKILTLGTLLLLGWTVAGAVKQLRERVLDVDAHEEAVDAAQAKADAAQAKADATQVKADATQVKADATQAKAEMSQLRADTSQAKADTEVTRAEMAEEVAHETETRATAKHTTYNRAVHDYRELVHHRILNPVTAIKGAAITMQNKKIVADSKAFDEMCEMIVEQCDRLERVTLDPMTVLGVEEHPLHPLPAPCNDVDVTVNADNNKGEVDVDVNTDTGTSKTKVKG